MNPLKLNFDLIFCAEFLFCALLVLSLPPQTFAETNSATSSAAPTIPAPPPPPRKQSRDAFREELGRILNANPPTCAKLTDCAAIPVGARACGGPTEYLVTSKSVLSKLSSEISDLTKAIAELDRALNAERQTMGICSIVTEPPLACQDHLCAAK